MQKSCEVSFSIKLKVTDLLLQVKSNTGKPHWLSKPTDSKKLLNCIPRLFNPFKIQQKNLVNNPNGPETREGSNLMTRLPSFSMKVNQIMD